MLMEPVSKAATVAMLFCRISMLAMGAGLTVSRSLRPFAMFRLVVLALLANFVLMPLGALARGGAWLDEPWLRLLLLWFLQQHTVFAKLAGLPARATSCHWARWFY